MEDLELVSCEHFYHRRGPKRGERADKPLVEHPGLDAGQSGADRVGGVGEVDRAPLDRPLPDLLLLILFLLPEGRASGTGRPLWGGAAAVASMRSMCCTPPSSESVNR